MTLGKVNKRHPLGRVWRKGTPPALLVGMQIGAASVEISMEDPPKLKGGVPYDPAIPLLCLYPKKTTLIKKTNKQMHLYVHRNTIYGSRDMKAT